MLEAILVKFIKQNAWRGRKAGSGFKPCLLEGLSKALPFPGAVSGSLGQLALAVWETLGLTKSMC